MSTFNRTARRKFSFEQLEERTVLSGSAIVANHAGVLQITGDNAANTLVVQQTGGNLTAGATIKVQGAATTLHNGDNGKSGTSFNFSGVTSIQIDLAGGGDVLTFINTNVSGDIFVQMGTGSDVLSMSNVRSQSNRAIDNPTNTGRAVVIDMGAGSNTATLTNVSTRGDLSVYASVPGDNGTNTLALNGVVAGAGVPVTAPLSAGSGILTVLVGKGKSNTVSVINCSAGYGDFDDLGSDGVLSGASDHFGHQSIVGFRYRSGDLRNNK